MEDVRPLLVSGSVVVGALALTETFELLPAALGAYAAAGWLLGGLRRPGDPDRPARRVRDRRGPGTVSS